MREGSADARLVSAHTPGGAVGQVPAERSPQALYLDLLADVLTRRAFDELLVPFRPQGRLKRTVLRAMEFVGGRLGFAVARHMRPQEMFATSPPGEIRSAETLIGPIGLANIRELIERVLEDEVPGDLIEAGVWRGGSAIYMRAVLAAHGDGGRIVWAADSFAGLPPPEATGYDEDKDDKDWSREQWFAVPLEEVKRNFERFGLLDDRVRFLVGWFRDTLSDERIHQLALIRLDGDMYGSTMDGLRALYPKLSVGGFVIIDDYWLPNCRRAVDEFRAEHRIEDEIVHVDRAVVYWRRSA